jgi:hypothetical protein
MPQEQRAGERPLAGEGAVRIRDLRQGLSAWTCVILSAVPEKAETRLSAKATQRGVSEARRLEEKCLEDCIWLRCSF